MTETKDSGRLGRSLGEAILNLGRLGHSAMVFQAVAILEYDLERCLKRSFNPLNARMENRLFGAYSPLGTFAAKIDIAFALGITTAEVHTELNKFRKIRNVFAHKRGSLSLETEPVKAMFYELKRPVGITGRYDEQFLKCVLIGIPPPEAVLFDGREGCRS
jgi:hypothetical protein